MAIKQSSREKYLNYAILNMKISKLSNLEVIGHCLILIMNFPRSKNNWGTIDNVYIMVPITDMTTLQSLLIHVNQSQPISNHLLGRGELGNNIDYNVQVC